MRNFVVVLCLCVLGSSADAQNLGEILARMDREAPNFHAISADIDMKTYTDVLGDTTDEKGTLKMQRLGPKDVRAIVDFTGGSDARVIAFLGKVVKIYYPNLKQVQEYEVGRNSDVLNQFLLLGFGSSGRELAQSYDITEAGQENLAGHDTTKLVLIPKDPKVLERLSKAELWIPSDAAYPIQQQFYEPSKNYRLVRYSNTILNPPIKGRLELKLPPGTSNEKQ
jgi:outer membrane lipoprotein-sorting protein